MYLFLLVNVQQAVTWSIIGNRFSSQTVTESSGKTSCLQTLLPLYQIVWHHAMKTVIWVLTYHEDPKLDAERLQEIITE
jgi:hypothetical protein